MAAAAATADPAAAPWPSAGRAWWAVAVFSAAAVVSYTDRQVLSLLVDPLKADLRLTDGQVGLVQGLAFVLIYGVAGLPLGRLADVAARRWVILAGVLIWSVSTAACGLAENFSTLFLARVGVGVGEAALTPAALSMIADLFPANRRGAAIGVFLMGMTLGSGVALASGGLVVQAATQGAFSSIPWLGGLAPWRATLVLLGAPGPVLALALLSVREPLRRDTPVAAGLSAPGRASTWRGFLALAPVLLPLYGAMALISMGDAAMGGWAPAFMARRFGSQPGFIGAWIGGASVLTGLAATLLGGVGADRLVKRGGTAARMVLAAAAAAFALSGALVGLAGGPAQTVMFFSLWALGSTLAQTVGITAVQEVVTNEMRGLAAAMNSLGNILVGIGTGTSLTAFLTDHVYGAPERVGWSISTVAVPVAVLSAALFWLTRRNLLRRAP